MTTKEELQKQINDLQDQLNTLPDEPKEVKKWDPKGGAFFIYENGTISGFTNSFFEGQKEIIEFGLSYPTQLQATKARDAIRIHNRLLSYVAEFGGDWEADWENKNQKKYHIDKQPTLLRNLYDFDYDDEYIGYLCQLNVARWNGGSDRYVGR